MPGKIGTRQDKIISQSSCLKTGIQLGGLGARLGALGGLKRFSGSVTHSLNKAIIAV
jgi:hypothetical protein